MKFRVVGTITFTNPTMVAMTIVTEQLRSGSGMREKKNSCHLGMTFTKIEQKSF